MAKAEFARNVGNIKKVSLWGVLLFAMRQTPCWKNKTFTTAVELEMKEWISIGSKKFWTITRLLWYRNKRSNHIHLRSTVTSKNTGFVILYTHMCIVFSSQYKTILSSDKLYTRLLLISGNCYLKTTADIAIDKRAVIDLLVMNR